MDGYKQDSGKLRMDLVPTSAIESIARVLTHGAEKYGENTWQKVSVDRYYAALLRHLMAWRNGEEFDAESGDSNLRHIEQVLTNAAFINELTKGD